MKKVTFFFLIIMAIMLFILCVSPAFSQSVPKGKANTDSVFIRTKFVKDTVIRGTTYQIYQGARGGKFILRTSAKGNVYKQYLQVKVASY